MKKCLLYIIVAIFISISCSKEEVQTTPKQDTFKEYAGKTYTCDYWQFIDWTTGEVYELIKTNSETDSIYLHFTDDTVIYASVDYHPSRSWYKVRRWSYVFGENDSVTMIYKDYERYHVRFADTSQIWFDIENPHHRQDQQVTAHLKEIDYTPKIIRSVLN